MPTPGFLGFPGSLLPKPRSAGEPARAPLPGPSPPPPLLAPPLPAPGPRRSLARAHRDPGRERKMSFPAARWRCQLIGRGRGPRAGLGASLAAAGAQLSGKNWGGCCGEISYRSLGGAAGPRSALPAAHRGRARWAGAGGGPLPPLLPPPPLPSSPPPPCSLLPFIPPQYRPTPAGADRRPLPLPASPPSLDHLARGPCFGGTRELAPRKDGRRGRGRVAPAGRRLQVQRVGASPAPRRRAQGSWCLGRCVSSLSLIYKPG